MVHQPEFSVRYLHQLHPRLFVFRVGGLVSRQEQTLLAETEEVLGIVAALVGVPYLLQREFLAALSYYYTKNGHNLSF